MKLPGIFLLLWCAITGVSGASTIHIHAELPPEVRALDVISEYQIDQAATVRCASYDAEHHIICSIDAAPGVHDLKLEISLPGYKRYVRLLPKVALTEKDLPIELNTLQFQRSSLQVVGVERKTLEDGSARFLINLHQEKPGNINILQIAIKSNFKDDKTLCAALTVPKATFVIKDQFTVSQGRMAGEYYEGNDKQALAPVEGTIVGWQCPTKLRSLVLKLQTVIGLRDKDTVIAVVLPKTFKIVRGIQEEVPNPAYRSSSSETTDVERQDAQLADPKAWEDLSLSTFKEFNFTLLLQGDEETTIVATFP